MWVLDGFRFIYHNISSINVREYRMDNQTLGTQDTRRRQTKQKTLCVGQHYAQTSTNK